MVPGAHVFAKMLGPGPFGTVPPGGVGVRRVLGSASELAVGLGALSVDTKTASNSSAEPPSFCRVGSVSSDCTTTNQTLFLHAFSTSSVAS